jgi:hypothetical protein
MGCCGHSLIPDEIRRNEESTGGGILCEEENISASMTWKDYHSPHFSIKWRKQSCLKASILVSKQKVYMWIQKNPQIIVEFNDSRIESINFQRWEKGVKIIATDVSVFNRNTSGIIEYFLQMRDSEQFINVISQFTKK